MNNTENTYDFVKLYNKKLDFKTDVENARESGNREELERIIKLGVQNKLIIKRELTEQGADASLWEAFGEFSGIVDAYEDVYRSDCREKYFIEIRDKVRHGIFDSIAVSIKNAKYGYIRHEDLAFQLGVEYNELTSIMRDILLCNFVQASGTGRNTRYSLCDAAKNFCAKYKIA